MAVYSFPDSKDRNIFHCPENLQYADSAFSVRTASQKIGFCGLCSKREPNHNRDYLSLSLKYPDYYVFHHFIYHFLFHPDHSPYRIVGFQFVTKIPV